MNFLLPHEIAQYEKAARTYMQVLNDRNGTSFPMPSIHWTVKGRTRLGTCAFPKGWLNGHNAGVKVQLSPMYARIFGEEYLATIAHEICHAYVMNQTPLLERRGRKGVWSNHGHVWKRHMISLGFSPDRTATLNHAQQVQLLRLLELAKSA